MKKILLSANHSASHEDLVRALPSDYAVHAVDTLSEAEALLNREDVSLLLLELDHLEHRELEFCEKLRAQRRFQDLPIVLLASRQSHADRIRSYSVGADDFIEKPIAPEELKVRVLNRLKRSSQERFPTIIQRGNFRIDLVTQKIWMTDQEGAAKALSLTPIEFRIMVLFLKNEGVLFSRADLMNLVWGGISVTNQAIENQASSLRKKLGDSSRFLKTVAKRGYYFSFEEDPIKDIPTQRDQGLD